MAKRKVKNESAIEYTAATPSKAVLSEAGISLKELRKALKEGQLYAAKEEWDKAIPPLLKAWEVLPDDIPIITLIAHGLARLGVREQAIAVLERALAVSEPTEELLSVMGTLAQEMEIYHVSEKLWLQLISMNPRGPNYYVNLATAYTGLGKLDESIEMLQQVLPLFPENSDLWNVLATQVRERDGVDAADVFFEEALRLNPNDLKIVSNYAMSFGRRNQFDKALELNLRSIEINPNIPEPHIGAGQILFQQGRMKEAWPHYEYRLNTRRKQNQVQIYTHGLPDWNGENLEGKTLFVTAEQGIGDEVMFGNYLPFLYDRAEKLIIGCEHRLLSLYRRRFPNAMVDFHVDQFKQGYRYRYFPNVQKQVHEGLLHVDFAIALASAPKFEWDDVGRIKSHNDPLLVPDSELSKKYSAMLQGISNKPKVGLSWRSGITSGARLGEYATVDDLKPLFDLNDKVDFINLQYGDCAAELEDMENKFGVKVHQMPDVDLKKDIEANVAIMSNCDLMVSPCSAPGMFAMSAGVPTIVMSSLDPWWRFGEDKEVLFVKDAQFVFGKPESDWIEIATQVRDKISEKLKFS